MVRGCALLVAIMLLCMCMPPPANAFDFRVNDFYGTVDYSNLLTQYSPTGAIRSSLAIQLPAQSYGLRGITFGPDHLLYAAVSKQSGFSVLALDSHGTALQTYSHSAYIAGDRLDGKIVFDNSGHFYVTTGSGVVRFDQAAPFSASLIYNDLVQDQLILPNGNLLVATDMGLTEITPEGQIVRGFSASDPNHLLPPNTLTLRGSTAIEYDPATNSVFVWLTGYSNFAQKLVKLDADTGALQDYRTWPNVSDMFMCNDGRLAVANWFYNARIYSSNFLILNTFAGGPFFVTQCVPEPSSMTVLICGLGSLIVRRRRR